MEIPIEYAGFEGRKLTFAPNLWNGGELRLDGRLIKTFMMGNKIVVPNNQGTPIEFRVRRRLLDPIPNLSIDGTVIELAKPLQWYEYLWIGLPLLLIYGGGAAGGVVGFIASYLSASIFRSERSNGSKYFLTGLVSVGSVVTFLAIAVVIHLLIRGGDRH